MRYDQTVDDATSRMATAKRTCDLILGVGDGKVEKEDCSLTVVVEGVQRLRLFFLRVTRVRRHEFATLQPNLASKNS